MAIYKLFPTQDATLYSLYPTMNTGLDAILEVSNTFGLEGTPDVARYLIQFDTDEIVDIIDNKINGKSFNIYLRNSIAEAQGINTTTTLELRPVAQTWNNGTGYFLDSPVVSDGTSWGSSTYSGSSTWSMNGTVGGYTFTGSYNSTYASQGGGNWFTTSSFLVTESFGLRANKDINLPVTNVIKAWYSSSIPNYGFIVKLSGSSEFNPSEDIQPTFKYYSVDTNTIYPPTLEFRWRDYETVLTGSATGSIVTTSNIKMSLAENPGVFFPESLNYLPTSSYYAIKDLATNEYVINFDDNYTQISSDSNGNYFTVYMSGLEPERYYKILIKTIINGSTIIFDDSYYFKVING
jgi:hypothetical protein